MTLVYNRAGVQLHFGDAREILPTLRLHPDTLVLTDPPYGTGGWRRDSSGAGSDPSARLTREAWDDGATDWLELVRPASVVMTFWSSGYCRHLLNAAAARGLSKHRTLYWRKPDPRPMPGGRTKWSVEPIWILTPDGFVMTGEDDCYEHSALRLGRDPEATGHPYQKPVKLLKWILAKSTNTPILDPFAGSGSTLVAAKALGRPAIGIEEDAKWIDVALCRLSQDRLRSDDLDLDWEYLETALCDFNAMVRGHHYVGFEIDDLLEQGYRALHKHLSQQNLYRLWDARAKVLPARYLGEINGWITVDRRRMSAYEKYGSILTRD